MRKSLFLFLFVLPFVLFAQVPEGLSYQGIALNSAGNQVKNTNIALRISILDNAPDGTVLYSETQTTSTSNKGLFGVIIGKGTVVSGILATINWGINSKFLKVEMDVAGGTSYVVVNNSQMMSVPYALYSGKTASVAGNTNINDEIVENRSSNFAFASSNGVVYVYNENINEWSSQLGQPVNLTGSLSLIEPSNKNFAFGSTNGVVYVYNERLNSWSSQLGSFATSNCDYSERLVGSNGNFAFAASNGVVYVYNSKLNNWSSQLGDLICIALSTVFESSIIQSNGNFAFAATNGVVYVYNAKSNSWSSQLGQIVNDGTRKIISSNYEN
jgi:hypothetical protein